MESVKESVVARDWEWRFVEKVNRWNRENF